MKPLITVFFIAAVGLLAAVAGAPRLDSGPTIARAGAGGASTLQDLQSGLSAESLAADDFDDRSLVFPRELKR